MTEDDKELKKELNKIVDMMIQIESLRESIASRKKDIKEQFEIPIATITKVATILRKESLDDEEAKWNEIKQYVTICK